MKKLICLGLCLVLCLSLAGCFGSSVAGSWTGSIDMAKIMNDTMSKTSGETAKLFRFENISLKITMTFNQDGTCAMTVDEESFRQATQRLVEQMLPGLKTMIEEASGQDLDALLQASGMTEDAFLEGMAGSMLENVDRSAMEISGNYMAKDGKLYLSTSASAAVTDKSPCYSYSIRDDVLTIDSGKEGDALSHLLPLVLHKVG